MARRKHIVHSECPYHVTARAHDGVWFHLPTKIVWEIMSDYLFLISKMYEVRIHSFVLMSNHFHLLISTPSANLSEAMNYFMRETSREMNRLSGRRNQVYGNRYFRSLISEDLHFAHVYKYIYRNPVSAGISDTCESYEFSTLRGLIGASKISIPLAEDALLFDSGNELKTLRWLNMAPESVNYLVLQKALKRRTLQFPKNRWQCALHTLDRKRL